MPKKFLSAVTKYHHEHYSICPRQCWNQACYSHFTGIRKAVQKMGAPQLNYICQNPIFCRNSEISNFVYSPKISQEIWDISELGLWQALQGANWTKKVKGKKKKRK